MLFSAGRLGFGEMMFPFLPFAFFDSVQPDGNNLFDVLNDDARNLHVSSIVSLILLNAEHGRKWKPSLAKLSRSHVDDALKIDEKLKRNLGINRRKNV